MPQLSGGQYGYETPDSLPPDFSQLLCRIVFVSKFSSLNPKPGNPPRITRAY
jgi:hypothetical protein